MATLDSFNSRQTLTVGEKVYTYYSIPEAEKNGLPDVSRLPFSLKVLLENLLRYEDGRTVKREDIEAVAAWLDPPHPSHSWRGASPRSGSLRELRRSRATDRLARSQLGTAPNQ